MITILISPGDGRLAYLAETRAIIGFPAIVSRLALRVLGTVDSTLLLGILGGVVDAFSRGALAALELKSYDVGVWTEKQNLKSVRRRRRN